MNKTIGIILGLVLLVVILVITGVFDKGSNLISSNRTENTVEPSVNKVVSVPLPPEILGTDKFVTKLQSVDTGCFSDGECFVMVEGKHLTVIDGRRQGVVGTIKGVESFGDLEKHIGEFVEVYAQVIDKDTFTLYGNPDFYIKLIGKNPPKLN